MKTLETFSLESFAAAAVPQSRGEQNYEDQATCWRQQSSVCWEAKEAAGGSKATLPTLTTFEKKLFNEHCSYLRGELKKLVHLPLSIFFSGLVSALFELRLKL